MKIVSFLGVWFAVLLFSVCEMMGKGSAPYYNEEGGSVVRHPSGGEFRGAWVYDPRSFDPEEVVRSLKKAGFNAVFVRLSSAGAAYYPSEVLPKAPGTDQDYAAAYVAAGRKYGVQIHAWHVCFMMHNAPTSEVESAIKDGKVMRDRNGRALRPTYNVPVRTPASASNRELESKAMVELVSKYDLDGVQFDYIRYFSPSVDFSATSRVAFEKTMGVLLTKWPAEVLSGKYRDEYHRWRTELISSVVREVSTNVHKSNPSAKISAAVWHSPDVAMADYAQDWVKWVDEGYLDFVVPMDYTMDNARFSRWVDNQRQLVKGRVPLYAGIGSYMLDRAEQVNSQISICRDAGLPGYVLYNYDGHLRKRYLDQVSN